MTPTLQERIEKATKFVQEIDELLSNESNVLASSYKRHVKEMASIIREQQESIEVLELAIKTLKQYHNNVVTDVTADLKEKDRRIAELEAFHDEAVSILTRFNDVMGKALNGQEG